MTKHNCKQGEAKWTQLKNRDLLCKTCGYVAKSQGSIFIPFGKLQ